MNSQDVRERFLDFFAKREHAVLPSASLVPENDPSALFTTAGVQPLVPYILQGSTFYTCIRFFFTGVRSQYTPYTGRH